MAFLRKIPVSALLAGDHTYLTPSDECYSILTYDCACNDHRPLIFAFKDSNADAIARVGSELQDAVPDHWCTELTAVPIPRATGAINHPVTEALRVAKFSDIRQALRARDRERPAHCGYRPPPYGRFYTFNESSALPVPQSVVLVDDVLTTGSHFAAAKRTLRSRWDVQVIGLFICRVCSVRQRCSLDIDPPYANVPSTTNPRCHYSGSALVVPALAMLKTPQR